MACSSDNAQPAAKRGSTFDRIDHSSSAEQVAYQRACAAFSRLQDLSQQLAGFHSSRDALGAEIPWDERFAKYLQRRHEWDEAFAEFAKAVDEYRVAIWGGRPDDDVFHAPRKPR
jgi:hypothetical protein